MLYPIATAMSFLSLLTAVLVCVATRRPKQGNIVLTLRMIDFFFAFSLLSAATVLATFIVVIVASATAKSAIDDINKSAGFQAIQFRWMHVPLFTALAALAHVYNCIFMFSFSFRRKIAVRSSCA